jgi:hypothetical protein
MLGKPFVLAVIMFNLFFSVVAYPEISQYFNHNGNVIAGNKIDTTVRPSQAHGHMVPEGIKLFNDVTYEFYPVFGKTISEIVRSAEENGPFHSKDRRRYPSKAEWIIGWSFRIDYAYIVEEKAKKIHVSLDIHDIKIEDVIKITLPTNIDVTALNPIEKALWKDYFLHFLEYEHEHVKILRNTDSKMELKGLFEDISYTTLDYEDDIDIENKVVTFVGQKTAVTGREWVLKLINKIRDLEQRTNHGLKNVAGTFPVEKR